MQPRRQVDTGADAGRRVDPRGTALLRVRFLAALSLAAVLLMVFAAFPALPLQAQTSTDATLRALTVNDGTNDLTLDPTFASGTYVYEADVGGAVDEVTLTATVNDDGAEVSGVTLGGTAITDTDFTDGITVPSLVEGDNVIVVTVTAEDTTTQPYTITVTRATDISAIPFLWSLKPYGLRAGNKFRLIFLSSTTRNANPTNIATYDTFIQGLVAAGHDDIRAYSDDFHVVGCTEDTEARDHTETRHSSGTGAYPYTGSTA